MNLKAKKLNDSELKFISGGLPWTEEPYILPAVFGTELGMWLGLYFLDKLFFSNDKKTNKKESA